MKFKILPVPPFTVDISKVYTNRGYGRQIRLNITIELKGKEMDVQADEKKEKLL